MYTTRSLRIRACITCDPLSQLDLIDHLGFVSDATE